MNDRVVIALIGAITTLVGIGLQQVRLESSTRQTEVVADYCGDRMTVLSVMLADTMQALDACLGE